MYGYLGTRIQNSLSATKLSLNIYFYAFFISNVVMCSLILAHCGGGGGGGVIFLGAKAPLGLASVKKKNRNEKVSE